MAESYQEEIVGFRFMSLSDHEFRKLQELLPDVTFTSRFRDRGLVVSFDLSEDFDLDSLCAFISESRVDPKTYSVWISLIASSDRGGVALPSFALAAIRRTSGGLDISFASSLEDAEPNRDETTM